MRTLKSTRQRIKMWLTSPVVVGLFVLLVLSVLLFLPVRDDNMRSLLLSRHFLSACVLFLAAFAVIGAMLVYAHVVPAKKHSKKASATVDIRPVRER